MEHIGVGQNDVRALSNCPALVLWRVAVIDRRAKVRQLPRKLTQRPQLILGECFGRKEIQRAVARVGEVRFKCRQVIAERFAGGGGGDDADVPPLSRRLEGRDLVAVQTADSLPRQCPQECGRQRWFEVTVNPGARALLLDVDDSLAIFGILAELKQKGGETHAEMMKSTPCGRTTPLL